MLIVLAGDSGRRRVLGRRGKPTVLGRRRRFSSRSICRSLAHTIIMSFRMSAQYITILVLALLIEPCALAQSLSFCILGNGPPGETFLADIAFVRTLFRVYGSISMSTLISLILYQRN